MKITTKQLQLFLSLLGYNIVVPTMQTPCRLISETAARLDTACEPLKVNAAL
tara:strand:- start:311 stop:466 length:156 start_codon:yes stop_codon:yes gene_type:complete